MTHLFYDDEAPKAHGEGVTRTSNPRAELWPIMVYFPAAAPMKSLIRAMNSKEAKSFAMKRHPSATKVAVISSKKRKQK